MTSLSVCFFGVCVCKFEWSSKFFNSGIVCHPGQVKVLLADTTGENLGLFIWYSLIFQKVVLAHSIC